MASKTDTGPDDDTHKHEDHTHHPPAPHKTGDDKLPNGRYKSPNCKGDETPSALFTFFARDKHKLDEEPYHSFMTSCQKKDLHKPDTETLAAMTHVSALELSKSLGKTVKDDDIMLEKHGIALGKSGTKHGASEISKHRMASNCGPTYNLNSVTSYNRFTCRYLGHGIVDGQKVKNPFQTWKGTLASCDQSLKISDQLENDVKMLAWDAAGGEEAQLDPTQFLCSIHSIPIQ